MTQAGAEPVQAQLQLRFRLMMKIHHYDEINHANLISWIIWGLLMELINFALLSLTLFDHFDTFPGGWSK